MAILVAALGSVYLVIALPLLDLYSERQGLLEDRRILASRAAALSKELPTLRARLAERLASASTSNAALEGTTDAIASANLQSHIDALATSLDVTLGSTAVLPAADRGTFRLIGLRIEVRGEYEGLVRLLAAIDTAAPPLILDNLHIRGATRLSDMPGSLKFAASFEVYGIRSNDTPVSAKR